MENILEVRDLGVVYKTSEEHVFAVNSISFELAERQTLGLVGETGAGKTTTALSILQLLPRRAVITSGSIRYKGQELIGASKGALEKIRGRKISMIFQDPMTALNPVMTVGAQVSEVLEGHNEEGLDGLGMEKKVRRMFKTVDIHPRRRKEYPHQFSGGMRQRIGIAIALACTPELLIADEPTTALDVTIQAQVLRLMKDLRNRLGMAMIMITHDLGVVAKTCDKVAVMYAGEIVEYGAIEGVFARERPHHPYTEGLFRAIPDLETKAKRLTPIEGVPADPTDLPDGCKFAPRCPKRHAACEQLPADRMLDGLRLKCHLFQGEEVPA
jgi:peptide/nickel transport system ATP-binding protein